jgi:hypothetical protein
MLFDNLRVYRIVMADAENYFFPEFAAIVNATDNQLKRLRWPVAFLHSLRPRLYDGRNKVNDALRKSDARSSNG